MSGECRIEREGRWERADTTLGLSSFSPDAILLFRWRKFFPAYILHDHAFSKTREREKTNNNEKKGTCDNV